MEMAEKAKGTWDQIPVKTEEYSCQIPSLEDCAIRPGKAQQNML